MQTCSKCHTQSADTAVLCDNCQADLQEWSETAVVLRKLQANPRVRYIQIVTYHDCCPTCREAYGSYAKDAVPKLPIKTCSNQHGCRCFYQPFLDEIFP